MGDEFPEGEPKFTLDATGEDASIEVVNLDTGERVYDPGIAEKAMGIFGDAIHSAGGTLKVPDDISSLFSDQVRGIEPPIEP